MNHHHFKIAVLAFAVQSIAAPINAETAALDDGQSVDEVIAHWAKENDLVVTKGARRSQVKSIIFNTNTYKKPSITIYPYPSDPEVIGSEAPREKKVGGGVMIQNGLRLAIVSRQYLRDIQL